MRHHARMLAIAVSQRAAWMLVPRPLNIRVSDAVSAHVAPRNGGTSVSAAMGCLQRMGHSAGAWRCIIMLDAGHCCVAGSSVSNAYGWAAGAENLAHLVRRQMGCLQQRMGHSAGAWRCIIMLDAGHCCVAGHGRTGKAWWWTAPGRWHRSPPSRQFASLEMPVARRGFYVCVNSCASAAGTRWERQCGYDWDCRPVPPAACPGWWTASRIHHAKLAAPHPSDLGLD